jgi:hypothetical protein
MGVKYENSMHADSEILKEKNSHRSFSIEYQVFGPQLLLSTFSFIILTNWRSVKKSLFFNTPL